MDFETLMLRLNAADVSDISVEARVADYEPSEWSNLIGPVTMRLPGVQVIVKRHGYYPVAYVTDSEPEIAQIKAAIESRTANLNVNFKQNRREKPV